MQHDAVAEIARALRRQEPSQFPLDLLRLFQPVHQTEPVRDADAVRVHDHRAGDAVHVAEDEVRGLAPHAGQRRQLLHRRGHLPAVLFQQHLRAGDDVPRFGAEKAAGVHVFLHLLRIGLREGLECRKTREERGRDLIDALVGALGGQPHGEEQLVGLVIVERAARLRVFRQQQTDDLVDLFLCTHLYYLSLSPSPPGRTEQSRVFAPTARRVRGGRGKPQE